MAIEIGNTRAGVDGYTPHVGVNKNWWLGTIDTGVQADYSSEEALRNQAEVMRATAEQLRATAEQLRASNELTREREFEVMQQTISSAMTALQQLSNDVATSESQRVRDEVLRNRQEEDRKGSEQIRATEENKRKEAEALRDQQEEARKAAETNRINEENKRKDAETLRNQQEEARKTAEAKRVAEEDKRIDAERLRAEKDAGRDAKITAVENKSAQLEQEQNLMRGDVQGVNPKKTAFLEKDIVDAFSIACVVKNTSESTNSPIFSVGDVLGLGKKCAGARFAGDKLNILVCDGGSSWNVYYDYLTVDKQVFVAVTYDGNTIRLYINAVKIGEVVVGVFDVKKYRLLKEGTNVFTNIAYNIRTVNTSISQQQVEHLYNQGRCDDVRLGDEWRSGLINTSRLPFSSWSLTSGCTYNETTDEIHIVSAGEVQQAKDIFNNRKLLVNQLVMLEFEYKGTGSIAIADTGNLIIMQGNYSYTGSSEYQKAQVIMTAMPGLDTYTLFKRNTACDIYIRNFKLTNLKLLNEYLPNFLTQTKWIDSGVNKQDIPYTSTTFTYIRPYKQFTFGSGAPSTPPDAAFVEYSDTVTGNIWKCGTKPNTRQFAVSDWKQINN